MKKLTEKQSWFKKQRCGDKEKGTQGLSRTKKVDHKFETTPNQDPPQTVLFVRRTPKGDLVKALRQVEQKLTDTTPFRVKLVERTGVRLKEVLMKSDPWEKEECGRPQCTTCPQDPKGGDL